MLLRADFGSVLRADVGSVFVLATFARWLQSGCCVLTMVQYCVLTLARLLVSGYICASVAKWLLRADAGSAVLACTSLSGVEQFVIVCSLWHNYGVSALPERWSLLVCLTDGVSLCA